MNKRKKKEITGAGTGATGAVEMSQYPGTYPGMRQERKEHCHVNWKAQVQEGTRHLEGDKVVDDLGNARTSLALVASKAHPHQPRSQVAVLFLSSCLTNRPRKTSSDESDTLPKKGQSVNLSLRESLAFRLESPRHGLECQDRIKIGAEQEDLHRLFGGSPTPSQRDM